MNGLRKNYHTYLAVCDSTLGELKDTTKVANPATSQLHSFNGVWQPPKKYKLGYSPMFWVSNIVLCKITQQITFRGENKDKPLENHRVSQHFMSFPFFFTYGLCESRITQLEQNGPLGPLGPLADPPDSQTGTPPCMAGCQTWIFCRKPMVNGYMANKTWGTWGTWDWWIPVSNLSDKPTYWYWWVAKRRVAGWVAGGCWDDDITSDDWDHSRKFPAFSTSKPKNFGQQDLGNLKNLEFTGPKHQGVFREKTSSDCQQKMHMHFFNDVIDIVDWCPVLTSGAK